jgi:NADPH-dependent 2,4-dienoyl-CoA reductase/sulfur reductase-like enzyme
MAAEPVSAGPVIIVGAGQAGGRAAEALRAAGYKGPLLMLGDEPHPPYERPALSKAALLGEEPIEKTAIHAPEWYAVQGIELRTGIRVEAIAPLSRAIVTAEGERIEYSELLLCTGSRVRPLPGAPDGMRGVHYLRTIESCRRLSTELVAGRRMVVIGGGFIGLEVASSAAKRGLSVTVVERQATLLERVLPAELAAQVEALHRQAGVALRLGAAVTKVQIGAQGGADSVELADGSILPADLVVVGIGIIPNTELAEAAGAASSDGVIVDEHCRTTVEHIHAAGDVTNHYNPILGRRVRLESWQNAQNQAIAAARNIAGTACAYSEVPWFWSDQLGTNIQLVGVSEPGLEIVWRGDRLTGRCMAFGLARGRVRFAAGFNCGSEIRFARRLIESRAQVSERRLADAAVKLKDLVPEKAAA